MNTGKNYYNEEGEPRSIWQMVKECPDWAASRIQHGEKLEEEKAQTARELLELLQSDDCESAKWFYKTVRRFFDIINVFLCDRCGHYQSACTAGERCKCGGHLAVSMVIGSITGNSPVNAAGCGDDASQEANNAESCNAQVTSNGDSHAS